MLEQALRILQKQQEVLARQTQRHQQEFLLLINLVSKHTKEESPKEDPRPAPVVAHPTESERVRALAIHRDFS